LTCALASCLMLGAAPAVFAQSTGATLRGQVSADSAPATDAKVTATNIATGLTRSVQANASGGYSLGGLPPGSYRIDVTAAGKTNSQNVTLQVGQTATLNLGVGGVAETAAGEATNLDTVTVIAPMLLETKTSEIATYVTQKQIDSLPQASRNFLAFADIVPGVTFTTGSEGSTSLRGGAQLSNGINVFIDGVGQKDYILKGGITGQDSSRGNPFPQLGIAEYKVITSNYKAEYDQLSSAGITAVTKSGTNDFHGDFFWDRTSSEWRKPTPAEEDSGAKVDSKEEQYGISFGGPIIKDQMHFFFAYEAKDYNSPRTITPGRQVQIGDLPPELRDIAIASSAPFKEDLYFGKIDWSIGERSLVELTMKRREEDEVTNVGGTRMPENGTLKTGEETRVDLRYQYNAENWLNDAHLTHEDSTFGPRPVTIAPGFRLFVPRIGQEANNNPDMEEVLNLGGGGNYQDKSQKGYSLQDDFTYFGWEGHTIKAGIKYKKIDLTAFEQDPYTPQFRYDINQSTTIPYFVEFTAPGNGNPTTVESDVAQLGFYIQDDWEVTEKLTLNLGVRWDYEKNPSYEDHVTPQTLVDRLEAYPNIQGPNVDYDINDYISTGNNRKSFKDAWQPRLGFSYDLAGDERHVFFGGAGRSYNRNQFDYLSYEQYRLAFQRYQFNFVSPGHDCNAAPVQTPCIAWDPALMNQDALNALIVPGANFGSEVFLMNNELKTPYSDQFSIGMRNSFEMLGNDWNSSVTLMHVMSHDGILFSIGNRRADGSFFPPGVNFGSSPGADLPGYSRFFLGDNGVETRLNSVLVSLDKPYTEASHWGASLAYTYSDAKENRPGSDNFTFDYPNLHDVAFFGARDIPKHKVVATGIYDVWGMTFSGKLSWTSPPGNNGLNCFERPDPGACDVGGRFETYYFDEQDFFQMDLAVQKEWDTGAGIKLRVRGDILNVTNEVNYTDFGNFKGVGGVVNPDFGDRTGLGITGPTRTFKLSMGLSW
jgi:outer membrane receptor protein involved in Fe transport